MPGYLAPVARAMSEQNSCRFSTHELALGEVLAAVSGASDLNALASAINLFDRSTLEEILRLPSAGLQTAPAAP